MQQRNPLKQQASKTFNRSIRTNYGTFVLGEKPVFGLSRGAAGGSAIIATTHFIADPADPLWRFSDSGMHAECFNKWEHRDEFATRYHNVMGYTLSGWVPAVPMNSDALPLPKTRLAVLGTPAERAEYFASLRADESSTNEPRTASEESGILEQPDEDSPS